MGDLKPFLERIVALRRKIIDDGIVNGVPFHTNDLQTVIERSQSEGTSFCQVTLPIFGKALDRGLTEGNFVTPLGFGVKGESSLPVFLYGVLRDIFEDTGKLRLHPSVTSIYFLRQFLLLDSKLIKEPSAQQREAAISGFLQRQERLSKLRLDRTHPVLQRAQVLLGRVLKRLDLSRITPGHGPGVVAEGFNPIERWDFRSWPARAERWYPFNVYGSQSFIALSALGPPVMVKNSVTKCALVPKDYKGPRLISAESAATQYLQQGQMKLIMEYVDNHPLLARSIRFRDQTHNQRMCQGAFDRGQVTLDLSDASDLVSAPLVWYLLAKVPKLRSQLFATRSQYICIKGSRHRLYSFSPMGSAVCFPVETLIFWALTLASVRFVQHHTKGEFPLPSEIETAAAVAVFGDDIIFPDYAMATVFGTLASVGCVVNTSKTCFATPFRESCGSEWFNGTDITIIRNKRYNYAASTELVNYPVLCDLQRKFFLRGLYTTAALLRQWVQEINPCVTRMPFELLGGREGLYRELAPSEELRSRRVLGTDIWRQARVSPNNGGPTGFPSGLDIFVLSSTSFDTLCCVFGFDASLDRGVRTRYNAGYQRYECRLPGVFQRTIEWDSHSSIVNPSVFTIDGHRVLPRYNHNYPRLLARVVGARIDRIAIRSTLLKMAWFELPSDLALATPAG